MAKEIVNDTEYSNCEYNENNGCYKCPGCEMEVDVCDECGNIFEDGDIRHTEYEDGRIEHTHANGCPEAEEEEEEEEGDEIEEETLDTAD